MPAQVTMPPLGDTIVEATVSRWLKRVGDTVNAYEPLLEVSTDKVDTEVPAPFSGVLLEILAQPGQVVTQGAVLALIGEEKEILVSETASAATKPIVSSEITASPTVNGGTGYTGYITPVVARMAAEHHLDLAQIKGTGREGRVTKKDVEAYLAQAVETKSPPAAQPSPASISSHPAPQRLHPVEPIPQGALGELIPLTAMRRAIAEHMVRSKLHTAPHVTTVFELDLSGVLAHRETHKADFAKQGVNLTLTAYFAAATVTALQANPYLNAQWTDEGIYLHRVVHLGIAVALDEGLIVPVVRNAQDLNLLGLARAVNDLAARARAKQLKPDETRDGTFTITNHGVSGSLFATPIINQPQVGILGVGVVEKRVKVINDAIAIRPCAYFTLTFDHRVADGATGDGFMLTLKQTLENWTL
jgi:2-oxoglutarate dehydrogenase E2 component (dihydrolipoamide succinyltransferase)